MHFAPHLYLALLDARAFLRTKSSLTPPILLVRDICDGQITCSRGPRRHVSFTCFLEATSIFIQWKVKSLSVRPLFGIDILMFIEYTYILLFSLRTDFLNYKILLLGTRLP